MVAILLKVISQQTMNFTPPNTFNNKLMMLRSFKLPMITHWLKPLGQENNIVRSISTTRILQTSDLKTKTEMEKVMNDIEDLFSTAKDEMDYAEESHGSVYYHKDHATAKKAVEECLGAYNSFLKDLPTDEMRQEVQGKVGMKLKELKMAFDALPMEDH